MTALALMGEKITFVKFCIKAMDLVLVDPGTVVGPNYRSNKVCLECLKLLGMTAGQLEHVVL